MPYLEIGLGLYFAATIYYAIQNENYLTIPFLVLFVWGYLYTGLMSLAQHRFEWLRPAAVSARRPCRKSPARRPGSAPGF